MQSKHSTQIVERARTRDLVIGIFGVLGATFLIILYYGFTLGMFPGLAPSARQEETFSIIRLVSL